MKTKQKTQANKQTPPQKKKKNNATNTDQNPIKEKKPKNKTVDALRLRTRCLNTANPFLVKENCLMKSNIMFVLYSGDYLIAVETCNIAFEYIWNI